MSNPFFNNPGTLLPFTKARSEDISAHFDLVVQGFNQLPVPAALWGGAANFAPDSGVADAYKVTLGSAVTAYFDGLEVKFRAGGTNTGASTLNVNNLGAVPIRRPDGSPLQAADISAGQMCLVAYSQAGYFMLQSMSAGALAAATNASASAAAAAASASAAAASAALATSVVVPSATGNNGKLLGVAAGAPAWVDTLLGTSGSFALALANAKEKAYLIASAPTASQAVNIGSGAVQFFTAQATNNFVPNLRFSAGTSLDSALAVGDVATVTLVTTQGATAYYATGLQIDGAAVTPKWVSGVVPAAGNASGLDIYSYTVIKTAAATFTVIGSMTQVK